MDVVELKRLVKGSISDGQLSLRASDLGSAAVDDLSTSFLPSGQLVMSDVNAENIVEPADQESITVVGTGSAVPFSGMGVEAVFSIRGGQAALVVTATGRDGWTFADSFPTLADTIFSSLAFDPSPRLRLASYPASDDVGQGMSFAGMLQLSSALGPFAFLLGTGSKQLSGTITTENGVPAMTLDGPLTSGVELGFFDLPAVTLEVRSVPFYNSVEDLHKAETFFRFATTIAFQAGGQGHSIPLSADLHQHQTSIVFMAGLSGVADAVISELSSLVDGLRLDHLLPSGHFSVEDAVSLTDLVLQVDAASTNKLSFVAVGAQTAKSWTLVEDPNVGKALSLDRVKFTFRLDDPMGARQLSLGVLGDMTLGQDGELEFNASSDLTFGGGLKQGKRLELKELYESFGGRPGTDMPDMEVRELDFAIQATSGDYTLNAIVDGRLSVPISGFDFGIEEVSFSVEHAGGGPTHLQVAGEFFIAGIDLTVSVTYDSDGGLELEGQTGEGEEIDFTHLIGQLFDLWGLDLPDNLPEIALENLWLQYNTTTKAFACRGQNTIASQLQIGSNVHQVDTYLDLAVSDDPSTGLATYAGFLRGQLAMGTAVFDLEWDFGAANILKGRWDGTGGGSLGFGDLAAVHGIDHSLEPPAGLDLALSRAAFEFDLTNSRFLLSADSVGYGEAFFLASNANRTWDFAFGVVMRVDQIPGFPDLGVLSLKDASLVLSTVRDDRFKVPSLPDVPPPPNVAPPAAAPRRTFPAIGTTTMALAPGVTVAAVLDVAQSAGSSVVLANLGQVLAEPELLVQAVIADPIAQSSFRGYLAGALTISGSGDTKIVLSNVYVQFQLDPLGVLVSGSVLVPLDAVTVEASGALVVTEEEMQAIFDVKAEADGQPAALPFPFGLLGVRLDELAVAVGMIFEPPGVDMGLEGRFNIIGSPVGSDEFALVLELEEEIPNPLYLSTYIASLSVSELITAATGQVVSDIPEVIQQVRAQDLLVYWSEAPGIVLPDRTVTRAGFGFNGIITVGSFNAHARLEVSSASGVSGDAEMSPIDWHGVLAVKGNGTGVKVHQQKINGQWQTVRKPQGRLADTPPLETREYEIVPSGGATLAFNTRRSPYIDVSVQVSLFNLANVDVEVLVSNQGFTFNLDGNIGSAVTVQFDCSLAKDGFSAHAEFDLDIAGDIGPLVILGVNLGTISLDVSLAAVTDVAVDSSGFTFEVAGKFWFDDHHLDLPQLTIHEDFRSLEELPGKVLKQIDDFAEQIFEDVFNEAKQLLEDAEAEAKRITDAIGAEHAQIVDDAQEEADRIAREAQQVYEQVATAAADAEGAAQELERQATKILQDAAAEVQAIGEAVEHEVERIEAEARRFLEDAAAEVDEIERVVAQEVLQLESQARQLLDDAAAEAQRIEEAVAHEVNAVIGDARTIAESIVRDAGALAEAMEHEAQKILDDIAAAAKAAVHWVEKTADDAWNTIKKY